MNDRDIFLNAPAGMPADQRERYLDQACGGDRELRKRAEALFLAEGNAGHFMGNPAPGEPLDHTDSLAPGTVIGRYKLLQEIGEGGFGVVYMAEQQQPVKRRVALKVIKLGMDTKQVLARFEAERQALAVMEHPNIAKVLDGGTTEAGRPFFVMELVRGKPITDYCDEHKLTIAVRLAIFIDVCGAVQHAHQKGIIHRDLKPSNVLITVEDDREVPKVIDFGVAKATQQDLTDKTLMTQFEQFIGTPAYMSPEQSLLGPLDVDTRSDIYSLGVLLYELLTGSTPFDARELLKAGHDEIRRKIQEDEPPKPSTRLSTLGDGELTAVSRRQGAEPSKLPSMIRGDLDWIVMKAMEKDRSRRYGTASGLALDIRRHLDHEPVTAAAPSVLYRLRKYGQRQRTALVTASGVALVLVLAAVVSTWQAIAATQAKQTERQQRIRAEENETVLQLRLAEGHLQDKQTELGLVQLADIIRKDPMNRVAVERLLAALAHREYVQQPIPPLSHGTRSLMVAEYGPEGQTILTGSADKTARIWDAHTGETLDTPLRHQGAVKQIQMSANGERILTRSDKAWGAYLWDRSKVTPVSERSPMPLDFEAGFAQLSPNGQYIFTSAWSKTCRLFDARSGKELWSRRFGGGMVGDFSQDSRLVAAGSGHRLQAWSVHTGEPAGPEIRHGQRIWSARFNPEGNWLVTASEDGTAMVWDVPTATPVGRPMEHDARVHYAEFSPCGMMVVTASFDRTSRIWDARSGEAMGPSLRHDERVFDARFNSKGDLVATASIDDTAQVWDVGTGQPLGPRRRHQGSVYSVRFSPDGESMLTASRDDSARVWATRWPVIHGPVFAHPRAQSNGWDLADRRVTAAHFTPDGARVVTAGIGGTAQVWDANSGAPLLPLRVEHPSRNVAWVELSRDGERAVSITTGDLANAILWDTRSGEIIAKLPAGRGKWLSCRVADFSPDHRWGAIGFQSGKIHIWKADTGEPWGPVLEHDDMVADVRFSPDSQRLLTASLDRTARIWDVSTGQCIAVLSGHSDGLNRSEYNAEGTLIVTASADNTACLWNAQDGSRVGQALRHTSDVITASFSPVQGSNTVLTSSTDGTAQLWDGMTGERKGPALRSVGAVVAAKFGPRGQRVATASFGGTARVWDTNTGLPISEPLPHFGGVVSVAFSPDGERLLTAGEDGTARLWHLPIAQLPAPKWLPEWADAVAGMTLKIDGSIDKLSWQTIQEVADQVTRLEGEDHYSKLGRWFYESPNHRTLTPSSEITLSEYVESRIRDSTTDSLEEAVRVDPDNGIALGLLAVRLRAAGIASTSHERRAQHYENLALSHLASQRAEHLHEVAYWLAWLHLSPEASESDYERALATFSRTLESNSLGQLDLLDELMKLFEDRGLYREAIAMEFKLQTVKTTWLRSLSYAQLREIDRTITKGLARGMASPVRQLIDSVNRTAEKLGSEDEIASGMMRLAALHAKASDWDAHQVLCEKMLERFEGSTSMSTRDRAAKSYLAVPPKKHDSPLLNQAVAMARELDDSHSMFPICRGMAAFRSSQDESALSELTGACQRSGHTVVHALAYPYCAMASHRLGQANDAKEFLKRAREAFANLSKLNREGAFTLWHDVTFAELALREAESLIEGHPDAMDETPPSS